MDISRLYVAFGGNTKKNGDMHLKSWPAFLSLFTLALIMACNVQPKAEIAAFGDSVTWGYGDLPGGWVRRVEQASAYAISNLGIPGETADEGDKRIDQALRTVPLAKVLFLLHGGNDWVGIFADCSRLCEPSTVEARYVSVADHLRSMRNVAANAGKKVVFLTYWPNSRKKCDKYTDEEFDYFNLHREYLNQKIRGVAAEHGDLVIPLGELQDFGADADFFDCLHPSPQGYKKISGKILEFVGEWAPEEASPKDIFVMPLRF